MNADLLLQRAVFLLALVSGYRASQLAALTRFPEYTLLAVLRQELIIAPSPAFLAKNEQSDSLIGPLTIQSLLEDSSYHPLCPVNALGEYLRLSEGVSEDHLFLNSRSLKPLSPRAIALLLCRVIEKADPGHTPRVHSICGLAASHAFLRAHSAERVRELGGLAFKVNFRTRYLRHSVHNVPCVALGPPPHRAPINEPRIE